MGALPVLAKPVTFDVVDNHLKPENDPICGGFTLGSNFKPSDLSNLKSWLKVDKDKDGNSYWIDMLEKETGQKSYFGFRENR